MDHRFLTPSAVEKLLQVKHHILGQPNSLAMAGWLRSGSVIYDCLDGFDSSSGTVTLVPYCGTAACIAGWVCLLNGIDKELVGPGSAMKILGISYLDRDIASRLFYTNNWDADLQRRFTTTNLRERASAAAEQIDRFINRHKEVA